MLQQLSAVGAVVHDLFGGQLVHGGAVQAVGQLCTAGSQCIVQLAALHIAQDLLPQIIQRGYAQRVHTHQQEQGVAVDLHGSGFAVGKAAQSIGSTVLRKGRSNIAFGQQLGLDAGAVVGSFAVQHSVDVRQGILCGLMQGTHLIRDRLAACSVDAVDSGLGQLEHLGLLVVVRKGIGAGVVQRDADVADLVHAVVQMAGQLVVLHRGLAVRAVDHIQQGGVLHLQTFICLDGLQTNAVGGVGVAVLVHHLLGITVGSGKLLCSQLTAQRLEAGIHSGQRFQRFLRFLGHIVAHNCGLAAVRVGGDGLLQEGFYVGGVLIGAGKLGYSIAELLSQEEYDIVVIDKEEGQLENIKENLDVLTMAANGSSPITMDNPDVQGADILIAVTGSDEVNMVCCILAKKHGITHTVARIRDMQFMSEAKDYLKANFDIDLMLNPEYITSMEINRILMVPAALNVEDFAEGRVRLFETKVRRNSPLAGTPLKNLDIPKSILAAMIFRDHRMIIPHGDDCLLSHDNAYFVGEAGAIANFSKNLVRSDARKISRAVIIGAGRAGRFTARILDKQGVQVKIFDMNRERCRLIAGTLSSHSMAIHGDGTNIDLLQSEGISDADIMICMTDDDKLNLLLALMGRHLGAAKTIVTVNRYDYIDLMEKVGVDIVLSSRFLAASEVLAFVRRGGIVSVSLLEGAKAEAIEVVVQPGAKVAGKKLMDAALPRECLVCGYVRNEEAFVPNGNSVLNPGDRAIIIVQMKHSKNVLKYFQKD